MRAVVTPALIITAAASAADPVLLTSRRAADPQEADRLKRSIHPR